MATHGQTGMLDSLRLRAVLNIAALPYRLGLLPQLAEVAVHQAAVTLPPAAILSVLDTCECPRRRGE